MPLTAGAALGPYVVVAPLGAGGMGEVYRARDSRLGRDVAIKVLPDTVAADPERLRRFENEARAAAALSHPNVLAVYDVNVSGTPCVVFELLEGETLRARLASGDLSPAQALDVACQVGRGLAAAHDKGIVHRDLKPDNVFLTRDARVKILDFGLARIREPLAGDALSGAQTLEQTEPGTLMGTRAYMAPEQVRGQAADHRSDIFALGILLYEMLSGQRAFHRPSPAETSAAILRDDPPPFPAGRVLPQGIERLLRRCLSKRPEDRFHSALDFVFALEALAPQSGPAASAPATRSSVAVLPFADRAPPPTRSTFATAWRRR
jgi:serine/threonine protein kinase